MISRRCLDACTLRSGPWFVRVRTRTLRLGEVVGGNLFRAGDWVELPRGRAWSRARLSDRRGNTKVSPLQLAQAYDGASESWFFNSRPGSPAELRQEPDFDESEILAREVSAMLADDPDELQFSVRARPMRNANCA